MIIYKNSKIDKKFKRSVIAIGNFDGLHLGHKKVLDQAKLKAKKNKIKFGVVTFEPMPVMFFNNKIKNHRINNLNQKVLFLKKFKLDFMRIIKFNRKFSKLTPEKFIKNIIYKNINCKFIYVSKNFRFGNKRKGNINTLKKYEKIFSYKTIISKPLKRNNKVLSSSIIRKKISSAQLGKVKFFLGRNWSIEGRVVQGKKRGRKIGFPTCNINLKDYVLAKTGVYAVKVYKEKSIYFLRGIANLGYRPTFNQKKILLEVNIFNFSGNLYNKKLTVEFVKFIREEKKFKGIKQLRKQIKLDLKIAKKIK